MREFKMKKTLNIKHSTSNIQCSRSHTRRGMECWLLNVGCSLFVLLFLSCSSLPKRAAQPLRALLITGGCCHDYEAQKKILTEGINARANVQWTIIHEGGDGKEHE